MKARNAFHYLLVRARRKLASKPSVGSLINFALTVACIIAITIAPKMNESQVTPSEVKRIMIDSVGVDMEVAGRIHDELKVEIESKRLRWTSISSWWTAITGSLLLLAAAMYLKFSEKAKYTLSRKTIENREWVSRQMSTAKVIHKTVRPEDLNQAKSIASDIRHVRNEVLECVQSAVSQHLRCASQEQIHATVMDFCGPDFMFSQHNEFIYASARTDTPYEVGDSFLRTASIAYRSVEKYLNIYIVNDVKHDPEWGKSRKRRKYGSAFAIPITSPVKGDPEAVHVHGALFVDCSEPYAFYGKDDELFMLVQPYLSAIALTYPADALHLEYDHAL